MEAVRASLLHSGLAAADLRASRALAGTGLRQDAKKSGLAFVSRQKQGANVSFSRPTQSRRVTSMVATREVSVAAEEELKLAPIMLPGSVLGLILGGGAGSRLYPLTKKRAKPAVPLGANYRLIDIPVSNCINSNIRKIFVLTQFNSASLNRHLARAYGTNMGSYTNEGFVEVLAAQQSPENPEWFQGTADAVRKYLWLLEEQKFEDLIILAGDHLYRMDYEAFILAHRKAGADITVGALPMDEESAEAFGVMKIDDTGRIIEFAEKPKGDALRAMRVDTTVLGLDAERAKVMPYIASMGIYVFKRQAIFDLLTKHFPDADDFGGEVIPGANAIGQKVQAHLFDGYWQDIGTIKAFYDANLALCEDNPPFNFYEKGMPIYTQSRYLPPARITDALVERAVIGDGCLINSGSKILHSVVGVRSIIGKNVTVEDALLMGADYYETDQQKLEADIPLGLNDNVVVRKCIIDKNARIGANAQIINKENVQEAERESQGFYIRSGIVTIIKDTTIPAFTVI